MLQDKFKNADLKSESIFFTFQSKNTHIRRFGPKFRHFYYFFFFEILHLDKFEGADFKYDNSFSKLQSNKTDSRFSNMKTVFANYTPKIRKLGTFVPKFKDFYLAPNLAITQF